jgi:Fic family protein
MANHRDSQRDYRRSHPWLTFQFRLGSLASQDWMRIGEALSKCDHIAGVPLAPSVAAELHRVYLAKGVHATTQIEGNTLSEDEVRAVIQGTLKLPRSQEYLKIEVENIINACQMIFDELVSGKDMTLTPERICFFNEMALRGLPKEGVTPGQIRTDSVVVGNVYRGAPAQDCEYLLRQLCDWLRDLQSDDAVPANLRRPLRLLLPIIAHLYIAWIHPFGDGNGRTARLVEFQLMMNAGLPTPACHLLSNYYNRTRNRYYEVLRETSRAAPYPIEGFIAYALDGFVEELKEQLKTIRQQQLTVAWVNYVHEVFRDRNTDAAVRQRDLVLSLPTNGYLSVAHVRRLPLMAERYAARQQKTVSRDINALVALELIDVSPKGIRARAELMSAFLPVRQGDPSQWLDT